MSDIDRAVEALILRDWGGEWDVSIGPQDLADAADSVALVLRVVRDDLALAALNGEIHTPLDIERTLNERIEALTGKPTNTGDTT